ncbi:HRDC-like protein [Catenaria anguillulae PL171]|uniref:HRDC-like protein n=1 Tax=Catenaria anguillulae PL171 TaxID=765915 RepID=A0A1Y2HVC8_9FUNG|nr:HRDC-like protein [Catenaria anguillulae PL171]
MSTFDNSRATMRKLRLGVKEDLEAGEVLRLGDDLQTASCLTVSEVHHFLKERKAALHNQHPRTDAFGRPTVNPQLAANVAKFEQYCEKFNQFNSSSTVVELRKRIEEHPELGDKLWEFEIAQIANFLVDSPEELKSLVPSLNRIDDAPLQELLDTLRNVQAFH